MFSVGLHSYSAGMDDGYGNLTFAYMPPLNQPGTAYDVFGWANAGPGIEADRGRRVITSLQLFAPDSFPATAYDVIDIGDEQYSVIGEGENYGNNPWWQPGLKVWNLREVSNSGVENAGSE
jgi:hypothetical protein